MRPRTNLSSTSTGRSFPVSIPPTRWASSVERMRGRLSPGGSSGSVIPDLEAVKAVQMAILIWMAERVGFEPTVPLRRHSLSRRARSAALAPLRAVLGGAYYNQAPKAEQGFRARGGTGRRTGLRIRPRKGWGFESLRAHHLPASVTRRTPRPRSGEPELWLWTDPRRAISSPGDGCWSPNRCGRPDRRASGECPGGARPPARACVARSSSPPAGRADSLLGGRP